MLGLKLGIYGGIVFALLCVGNFYGPNALWRAHREAEDKARNAVLSDLAERETAAGTSEAAGHAAADKEFAEFSMGLGQCPLTPAQSAAVNLVRE